MNQLLNDVRFGARLLIKRPAFSLLVIFILALGTGANTAIFSVLNAVVLRPLPYKDPGRLYEVEGKNVNGSTWISAPDFNTWRERTRVFEQMAAAQALRYMLTNVDEPEELFGLAVSPECFPMLGTPPLIGRVFAADDYRADAPPVVMIGYRLWTRRFGGARNVVGKTVTLEGRNYTVTGVMPPPFAFDSSNTEFWTPLTFSARYLSQRDWRAFMVFARLRPGISRRQADAEAEAMSRAFAAEFPKEHENWSVLATPLEEKAFGEARGTLLMLLGAVGFVMLIACFNVANLLLSRASERTKEIAIRISLGASRMRLIRQLITESLLLALAGGALGLLVASWSNRALVFLFPARNTLPRLDQTSIDLQVLAFTLVLCCASALVFGLVPALRATRPDVNETLKEAGRTGAGGARAQRFRNALIVAETALSLVLLCGAGLMLRSFVRLTAVDPGFQPRNVLTMRLPLPQYRIPDRKQQPLYYNEILKQVQTLPDVHYAALSTVLPLTGMEAMLAFAPDAASPLLKPGAEEAIVPFRAVSSDYFRALGIPLLLGRAFSEADTADAPRVVIVNQTLARQCWPGENPIGKQMHLSGSDASVVGIVGDIRHRALAKEPQGELYLPFLQFVRVRENSLIVQTQSHSAAIAGAIRKKIRGTQRDQPIADVRTFDEVVSGSVSEPRLYAVLLGVFGFLALALAGAGIYGVLSCSAVQRRQEIGIRMALGATRASILRMMITSGIYYVLAGIAVGAIGAFAATRLMSKLLYQVKPGDPLTFVGVSLLLLGVALAAIYLPSRRATAVDALVALRCE